MVAQWVWSKSTPGTCVQPCTHRRALSFPLRFFLYTHVNLTRRRPAGSLLRSRSVHDLFFTWLLSSVFSAPCQPGLSR
jgi:hypothetical protein